MKEFGIEGYPGHKFTRLLIAEVVEREALKMSIEPGAGITDYTITDKLKGDIAEELKYAAQDNGYDNKEHEIDHQFLIGHIIYPVGKVIYTGLHPSRQRD